MAAFTLSFNLDGPAATDKISAALARLLRAGDCVLLSGDVGAGKTHFARGVIRSLLATPEDIPSPTFTLVQTYETPGAELWHADLYRLTDVAEIEELGLTEAFTNAICLVEWPDRLGPLAPADALVVSLAPGAHDDSRIATFDWTDPKWTPIVQRLTDDTT